MVLDEHRSDMDIFCKCYYICINIFIHGLMLIC